MVNANRREFLTGLAATTAILPAVARAATPIVGARVYVIDGQSNAVGWGLGPFVWKTSSFRDSRIKQIGRFDAANMRLIDMTGEPLHFWENNQADRMGRHGFGISTVRRCVAARSSDHIAIIVPVAHNGMSVLQQLGEIPGPPDWWGDTCARIDLALSYAGSTAIDGWFCQQGERDVVIAANPSDPAYPQMPDADHFAAAKQRYIDRVRTRYGTGFPFLMGKMCPQWTTAPAGVPIAMVKNAFDAALDTVAASNPACATINSNGLYSSTDLPVHFDAASAETLAWRYYSVWKTYAG